MESSRKCQIKGDGALRCPKEFLELPKGCLSFRLGGWARGGRGDVMPGPRHLQRGHFRSFVVLCRLWHDDVVMIEPARLQGETSQKLSRLMGWSLLRSVPLCRTFTYFLINCIAARG